MRLAPWLLIVLPTIAFADAASDAKDQFERGRLQRAGGDCAHAVVAFRKAYEIYPSGLGSLRNVAECEEELHHWATARRAWLELKRAVLAAPSPKYKGWDTESEAAALRLVPKVSEITIALHHEGDSAVRVTLNDAPLESALVGVALERDPGTYVIKGDAGDAHGEERVDVAAGDKKRIEIKLVETTHPPPKVPPTQTTPSQKESSWTTPAAITSFALGGALAIAAGVSIVVYSDARSSLDAQCPSHTACDPSLVSPIVDRGQTAATLVNVFTIAAGVALVAGIVFILATPSQSRTVTAAMNGRITF